MAQGSTGNVIAALCSFFAPGLGQLLQGRLLAAILWLLGAGLAYAVTWVLTLSFWPFGWFLVSVFACIDAATWKGRPGPSGPLVP